jgi:hypothetical protein
MLAVTVRPSSAAITAGSRRDRHAVIEQMNSPATIFVMAISVLVAPRSADAFGGGFHQPAQASAPVGRRIPPPARRLAQR